MRQMPVILSAQSSKQQMFAAERRGKALKSISLAENAAHLTARRVGDS